LEGKNLSVGYFVKVGTDLLFVNGEVAIKLTFSSAEVLEGYEHYDHFESVVALENGYFAVVNSPTGIHVYKYTGAAVKKTNVFN
jgi:hypothetical protein